MSNPLAGRIALVTGASRGIGYVTAQKLAAAGAHVVAVARTVGGLEELDDEIRKLGGSATLVPLDVRDDPGLGRLAAPALAAGGSQLNQCHCEREAIPTPHACARKRDCFASLAMTAS